MVQFLIQNTIILKIGIGSWFVLCLRSVRNCYAELLLLHLHTEALDAIRDLLHDLRQAYSFIDVSIMLYFK